MLSVLPERVSVTSQDPRSLGGCTRVMLHQALLRIGRQSAGTRTAFVRDCMCFCKSEGAGTSVPFNIMANTTQKEVWDAWSLVQ